jgi:hypothetical protein
MLERFQHQHAAAAGDDEAVAVGVVGARGALGGVVVELGDMAPMASNSTTCVQSAPRRRRRT